MSSTMAAIKQINHTVEVHHTNRNAVVATASHRWPLAATEGAVANHTNKTSGTAISAAAAQ